MTPLSSRYATAAALALVAAGTLNLVISQDRTTYETCANPNALPRITRQAGFEPRGRMHGRLTDTVIDWAQGTIRKAPSSGSPMEVWMIRSIRPAELYERPVRFLDRKVSPEAHDLLEVETKRGTIPVHILEDYTVFPGAVVGYLLVYGNEPSGNAFWTHARHLWDSVTRGRAPLTLFLVSGQASRRGSEAAREDVSRVLAGAWENFDAACRH